MIYLIAMLLGTVPTQTPLKPKRPYVPRAWNTGAANKARHEQAVARYEAGKRDAIPEGWVLVPKEPVGWTHSCPVLCLDGVELWIDRCPHCGKPAPKGPK